MREVCVIEGCGKPVLHWEWCSGHYQRWRTHGDPLAGRTSPVSAAAQRAYIDEVVLPFIGDECLTWPFSRSKGYGIATIDGVRGQAHRGICRLAHGEPPTPDHQAAHSCGKGHLGCVNPRHLRWATPKENSADTFFHGTAPVGVSNPAAALSEETVLAVWASKGTGTAKQIGSRFGIPFQTVADILGGRHWADLTGARPRGRYHGSEHHASKLAASDVLRIRELAEQGRPYTEIAAIYGVTPQSVRSIVTRRTWAWLRDERVAA